MERNCSAVMEEQWLEMQVTRADGTAERPFIASYWHRKWTRRLYFRLTGRRYGDGR